MNRPSPGAAEVHAHSWPSSPSHDLSGFTNLALGDFATPLAEGGTSAPEMWYSNIPIPEFEHGTNWAWPPAPLHIAHLPTPHEDFWWTEPSGSAFDFPSTVGGLGFSETAPIDHPAWDVTGKTISDENIGQKGRSRERRREQNRKAYVPNENHMSHTNRRTRQQRHRERRELTFHLAKEKVVQLQQALATLSEQEKHAKKENTELRQRLASLEAEIRCLRKEAAASASASPAGSVENRVPETPSEFHLDLLLPDGGD